MSAGERNLHHYEEDVTEGHSLVDELAVGAAQRTLTLDSYSHMVSHI